MFSRKKVMLLDMNSTFMFGEDKFGLTEDFSIHYHQSGGLLSKNEINTIIRSVYSYLDAIYRDNKYRHNFPSLESTICHTVTYELDEDEMSKIVDTFAFHEIGYIPDEYIAALHKLNETFKLAVVIDIWSPKSAWLKLFNETGIDKLFRVSSFSSDHGIVKPSPKPFNMLINELGIEKYQCLMIGDSVRRDLGGANSAGIDCILVGGAQHPDAVGHFENLVELSNAI